jgi:hypothetical protein
MKEVYKIKELEQIRLLSDPLKLQLLQAFAESAKTTKQVAKELGEGVTKLYRHVDALHNVGLLEILSEQKKRGTVERTFRAVAERFEADHALFADQPGDEGSKAVREMLRAAEEEIVALMTSPEEKDEDLKPIIMRFRCRASRERIATLRGLLAEWVDAVQQESGERGSVADEQEIGALIAFYPIEGSNS